MGMLHNEANSFYQQKGYYNTLADTEAIHPIQMIKLHTLKWISITS
jgi:hypothetical protein